MSDAQFALPEFTIYRNDRNIKRGGGVAIYVRNALSLKFILSSVYIPDHPEYIFIEIWHSSKQKKVLIVAV